MVLVFHRGFLVIKRIIMGSSSSHSAHFEHLGRDQNVWFHKIGWIVVQGANLVFIA